jgi:hypothetical protein
LKIASPLWLCAALFFGGFGGARLTAQAQSQSQDVPEALKGKALTVSINAYVLQDGSTVAWQQQGLRYTVPGTPVAFRLVGSNVVIAIQITPYENDKGGAILVTQGQIWVKGEGGELSYRTTLESVLVRFGEKVLFFPLGRSADGRAPLCVELSVDHYNELGKVTPSALDAAPRDGKTGDGNPPPPADQGLPSPPPPPPGKGSGK